MSENETNPQETKVRLRIAVSGAYALVRGLSLADSLATASPEQMMAEHVRELEGPSTNPRRPSRLEQVRAARAQFQSAVSQIRSMSPEELALSSAQDGTSSALAPEGDGDEA